MDMKKEDIALIGGVGLLAVAGIYIGYTVLTRRGTGGGTTNNVSVNLIITASAHSLSLNDNITIKGSGFTPNSKAILYDNIGGQSSHNTNSIGQWTTGSFAIKSVSSTAGTIKFWAVDASTDYKTSSLSIIIVSSDNHPSSNNQTIAIKPTTVSLSKSSTGTGYDYSPSSLHISGTGFDSLSVVKMIDEGGGLLANYTSGISGDLNEDMPLSSYTPTPGSGYIKAYSNNSWTNVVPMVYSLSTGNGQTNWIGDIFSSLHLDKPSIIGKSLSIKYNAVSPTNNILISWGDGSKNNYHKLTGTAVHNYNASGSYIITATIAGNLGGNITSKKPIIIGGYINPNKSDYNISLNITPTVFDVYKDGVYTPSSMLIKGSGFTSLGKLEILDENSDLIATYSAGIFGDFSEKLDLYNYSPTSGNGSMVAYDKGKGKYSNVVLITYKKSSWDIPDPFKKTIKYHPEYKGWQGPGYYNFPAFNNAKTGYVSSQEQLNQWAIKITGSPASNLSIKSKSNNIIPPTIVIPPTVTTTPTITGPSSYAVQQGSIKINGTGFESNKSVRLLSVTPGYNGGVGIATLNSDANGSWSYTITGQSIHELLSNLTNQTIYIQAYLGWTGKKSNMLGIAVEIM